MLALCVCVASGLFVSLESKFAAGISGRWASDGTVAAAGAHCDLSLPFGLRLVGGTD